MSRRRLLPIVALVFAAAVAGTAAVASPSPSPSPSPLAIALSGRVTPPVRPGSESAPAAPSLATTPPPASIAVGGDGVAGAPSAGRRAPSCPSSRRTATGVTRTVPILMYHQFGDPRPTSRWPGLFVRASDFAAQLHALAAHGWTAITAAALGRAMETGQAVPAKSYVVTIDDGELSAWTTAFPILQRDCIRATYYVPAAFVGQPGHITASDLAAIALAGDEIGNHSMTHINLGSPRLTAAKLLLQTMQAAARLRADLARRGVDVPITTFAYPSGRFAAPVVALLRQLGYTLAVTTAHGLADIGTTQPLLTPRIRVSRGETASQLLAQLP